jgi:hypothetical protein
VALGVGLWGAVDGVEHHQTILGSSILGGRRQQD